MTTSLLYYECHVTTDPVFGDKLALFKEISAKHGFRVAELFMQKRPNDAAEPSTIDSFTTGRGRELSRLQEGMIHLIADLGMAGIKVRRYKIEDTILDSRINDELEILK